MIYLKDGIASSDISDPGHRRLVRRDFPSITGLTFLASSGRAPMPKRTVDRMHQVVSGGMKDPREECSEEAMLRDLRREASRLIGSRRDEVTFIPSTTRGISLFADSLPLRSSDEILLCSNEYPSNAFPWLLAARRARAKVGMVDPEDGLVDEETLERNLSDRTRVLPLSYVHFGSGQRMDLGRVSRACEEHGTLLFLDAIQALGAVDLNVRKHPVAGLSAGGYKWLCGPRGSGMLFVSSEVIDGLKPREMAWNSMEKGRAEEIWRRIVVGEEPLHDYEPAKDISAFDVSVESFVQMAGLAESVRYIRELGTKAIERRIERLNTHLMDALDEAGYRLVTPRDRRRRAGIVSFAGRRKVRSPEEADELMSELGNVRIFVRHGLFRIAPHFFNNRSDIDRAVTRLTRCCRRRGMI